MTREEMKEYQKAWYQAHKEDLKPKMKAYNQAHKEQRKATMKAWKEAHKEECKAYGKAWCEANKESVKAWYQAHKESVKAKTKAYYQDNKEKVKAYTKAYKQANKEQIKAYQKEYMKEYTKTDLNSLGQTKHSIRQKSQRILKKMNLHIPRYEIHHAFGYEDASKFIYISKSLHLKIHKYLREHNIDADSDHWLQIADIVNSTYEFIYIKS